jgi:hypothetical protein
MIDFVFERIVTLDYVIPFCSTSSFPDVRGEKMEEKKTSSDFRYQREKE